MSTQRKTELGRDLQRRADACVRSAGYYRLDPVDRARLEGKAQAYEHAAELADALDLFVIEPEPEVTS